MATDATGTPTSPDGLAKINTSVDAPSGVGQNSLADSVQTALTNNYIRKPASIATGEAAVWNGSGWDRSSVTRLGATSLGSGTPSATTHLGGDSTWQNVGVQNYTPTWSSAGTQPALGNGTLTGRYVQIGKLVVAELLLVAGSTTTFGTGIYTFSLPVTSLAGGLMAQGGGRVYLSGFGSPNLVQWDTGGNVVSNQATVSFMTATNPITLANGSTVELNITYLAN